MKKALSILLLVILVFTMPLTTMAATPNSPHVTGTSEEASRVVETKSGTKKVSFNEHKAQALKVFEITNKERKANGLEPYVWVDELYDVAVQRAAELYVSYSHTRPNGTIAFTASPWLKGENIYYGPSSAQEAMNGWMKSAGHKDNIMGSKWNFQGMAVACIDTEKDSYWVQLFAIKLPNGETSAATAGQGQQKQTQAGAGVQQKETQRVRDPQTHTTTHKEISSTTLVNSLSKKTANAIGNVSLVTRAADILTPDNISAMNKWTATSKKGVRITFDSVMPNSKLIEGRMTIDPAKFAKATKDIPVAVRVSGSTVDNVIKRFAKWYSNDFVVVRLGGSEDLVAPANIAAYVNVKDMNTDNLVFYKYNVTTNQLDVMKDVQYKVDSNGYIHFATTNNCTIISDKALTKK